MTPENVSRGRSAQEELSSSPRSGASMESPVALSRIRTITTFNIIMQWQMIRGDCEGEIRCFGGS